MDVNKQRADELWKRIKSTNVQLKSGALQQFLEGVSCDVALSHKETPKYCASIAAVLPPSRHQIVQASAAGTNESFPQPTQVTSMSLGRVLEQLRGCNGHQKRHVLRELQVRDPRAM